jgi:hypothetical protein
MMKKIKKQQMNLNQAEDDQEIAQLTSSFSSSLGVNSGGNNGDGGFSPCMTPSFMCPPTPMGFMGPMSVSPMMYAFPQTAYAYDYNSSLVIDYQQFYQFIQQQTHMYLTFAAAQQGIIYQPGLTQVEYVNHDHIVHQVEPQSYEDSASNAQIESSSESDDAQRNLSTSSPIVPDCQVKIDMNMPQPEFSKFYYKLKSEIHKINRAQVSN